MDAINQMDKDSFVGLARKLARQNDPQSVGKKVVFYVTGNRPQEAEGLNLKASAVDPSMKAELHFGMHVARQIVPEYEHVRQEGELEGNGEATFTLER